MLLPIDKFNALPVVVAPERQTHWHFDLRYLPLEPRPHHILLIARVDGSSSHIARLPLGLPAHRDGMDFFPDTPADAAPTVARALVHSFTTNAALSAVRPMRLMTPDTGLAKEVGNELKRIGVKAKELQSISKSTPAAIVAADELFEVAWKRMMREAGFQGLFAQVLGTPEYINMSNLKLREPEPAMNETPSAMVMTAMQRRFLEALEYTKIWYEARPPTHRIDYSSMETMKRKANYVCEDYLPENPAEDMKEAADEGIASAAFDYALRLMIVPKHQRDRQLIHKYLMMAIRAEHDDSPKELLTEIASNAHAILIHWYALASKDEIRQRYLFAACHHAEQALRLAKQVSPPDHYAAPVVLSFIREGIIQRLTPDTKCDPLPALVMYKECRAAHKLRVAQLKKEKRKLDAKRVKQPNRYRCANPDCGIIADKGKMLQQCGGKCDVDKKPSYCSKDCQRADRKNHKDFCKPGMPCSVIDTETSEGPTVAQGGLFSIPIQGPNGQVMHISSSTMTPEELREFRDAFGERESTRLFESGIAPIIERYEF
ncbi:hypothetical protein BD626DRAFT_482474 [Schizophyllum amplum]|uniref:Uncharacterized protein n=1 Tax=Schizophyllum amplum TaxID=97359 RepID=A0A550CV62_9AGAR|nr:hypothetical protein BD626DRAFT_482474 [Auriculariopsis ampla]